MRNELRLCVWGFDAPLTEHQALTPSHQICHKGTEILLRSAKKVVRLIFLLIFSLENLHNWHFFCYFGA